MILLPLFLTFFLNPFAQADNYVECEKEGKFELALTATNITDYSGAVGKTWELKLVSLDRDWITVSDLISATNFEEEGKQVVEVSIGGAIKYKVIDIGSESPTLEKHITPNRPTGLKFSGFTCYAIHR